MNSYLFLHGLSPSHNIFLFKYIIDIIEREKKLLISYHKKSLWQLCSLPTVSHQNIGEYIDQNRVAPLFDYMQLLLYSSQDFSSW